MNAKKIMGAVLVALLAAALFVGAGAAADDGLTDKGTIYTNVEYPWLAPGLYGDAVAVAVAGTNGAYIVSGNYAADVYYNNDSVKFKLTAPTGAVLATNSQDGNVIGGKFTAGETVTFDVVLDSALNGVTYTLAFVKDGIVTNEFGNWKQTTPTAISSSVVVDTTSVASGKWGVMVQFLSGLEGDAPTFGKVYEFTVAKIGSEVTLSADTVIAGETFTIAVEAAPGKVVDVLINADYFKAVENQPGVTVKPINGKNYAEVTIGSSGTKTIGFETLTDGEVDILVYIGGTTETPKELALTITEGSVTVESDKGAYFIGEEITFSGESTINGQNIFLYIEGTNLKIQPLGDAAGYAVDADDAWEAELKIVDIDAGTYTIYAVAENVTAFKTVNNDVVIDSDGIKDALEAENAPAFDTVAVNLKQPFLTAELQSSVVAQGSDLVVTGTAESATEILWYVFGTNFFDYGIQTVKSDSTYKIEKRITADNVDAGQYFAVIQHPMYNGEFNIAPEMYPLETSKICLNTSYDARNGGDLLFTVSLRQTANAAEALCQALDSENIDDIYVKASFIVAAPTATMNPIPSEVAKGTKIAVSGTTNLAPGSAITVQMLSTAFTAVPKDAVNSASFIALTTKVADDGTWEVTFDTTGLNIDEYTITATAGQFVSTAKVNVVEAAPEQPDTPDTPDVPDTPDTPDTPDVPETPGFGALAALAGLGAVAVLLLRRE